MKKLLIPLSLSLLFVAATFSGNDFQVVHASENPYVYCFEYEEKSKEIKRNIIVPNEYNEYTTVMETETERYLSTYQTTLEQRFNELSVIEEITTLLLAR